MAEKIIIRAHEDHVLQRVALLKFFRRKRGERKTADFYMIPLTTNRDVRQLLTWWDEEYQRSRASNDWYKDEDKRRWLRDREAIARELEGAEPDALYPRNPWFWNRSMLKLSILLQVAKTRPSPTELFVEALKETVEERIQDTNHVVSKAGDAVETVAEAGSRAWSGLKIAGIVAAGLVGAAFVVPPIVRAFRE